MSESNSEQRPKRRLSVRNFSVIKEAELEFGKITVLIGPQASGKSLLCKLAYFLSREAIKIAIDLVVNRLSFTEFESAIQQEFVKWFPRGGWGAANWSISFRSNLYEVSIHPLPNSREGAVVNAAFGRALLNAYALRLEETIEEQNKRGIILAPALQSRAATAFFKTAGRGVWDASTYIPTQRSYFVDIRKGYRTLAAEADPISAHFADVFANALRPSSSGSRVARFLRGDIVSWQNEWMISFHDGRFLALSDLSSGDKETLPILTALDYYESQRTQSGNLPSAELYSEKLYEFDDFTIEEPELSVFPQTQYEIVREIVSLTNQVNFLPRFTITTHSPYILSAFGNLIKAGQVAHERPEQAEALNKVTPEEYWIDPSDFRAYALKPSKSASGKFESESIIDEKTAQIDGDYLDDVSSDIAEEFGQLLELQYGK